MYVGHNPAAADVTEILIGGPVDFPTSAIAIVGLDADWPGLSGDPSGTGSLASASLGSDRRTWRLSQNRDLVIARIAVARSTCGRRQMPAEVLYLRGVGSAAISRCCSGTSTGPCVTTRAG